MFQKLLIVWVVHAELSLEVIFSQDERKDKKKKKVGGSLAGCTGEVREQPE